MNNNRSREPRDPNNLTVSEIDRYYDSDSGSEAYSSGVSYRPSDESDSESEIEADTASGGPDASTVSSHSNPDSPQPSTSQIRHTNLSQIPLVWDDNPIMKTFLFNQPTGLRVPTPENNSPIDYFNLVVDEPFLKVIINETNANAEEVFLSSGTHENS
ncbi:hypothetical protein J6590_022915 [Homalodisca vitripennis]|nr:hypothetical protein J6590_022915 [Homalodisca vitripennis]